MYFNIAMVISLYLIDTVLEKIIIYINFEIVSGNLFYNIQGQHVINVLIVCNHI